MKLKCSRSLIEVQCRFPVFAQRKQHMRDIFQHHVDIWVQFTWNRYASDSNPNVTIIAIAKLFYAQLKMRQLIKWINWCV